MPMKVKLQAGAMSICPASPKKAEPGRCRVGDPAEGQGARSPLRGATKAETCALVKKRAGAAKKVPQNRPHRRVAHGTVRKAIFAENSRPESSDGSRIGQKKQRF